MGARLYLAELFARVRRARARQRWQRDYEKSLNDRAHVEEQLLYIARGKAPLPDREQCRKWAIKLGVPAHWRNDAEALALRALIDAAQEVCDVGGLGLYAHTDVCVRVRIAMANYRRECAR